MIAQIDMSGVKINYERIGGFLLLHYLNKFNTFEIEVIGPVGDQIFYQTYKNHYESYLVYSGIKVMAETFLNINKPDLT